MASPGDQPRSAALGSTCRGHVTPPRNRIPADRPDQCQVGRGHVGGGGAESARAPPSSSLEAPLWEALAEGMSPHLGIEYRLIVRINAKWGVATSERMTPRGLLAEFGFDPAQFSLYRHDSNEPLPPDVPLHLHRDRKSTRL